MPAPINGGVTGIPPPSTVVPRSIAFSVLNGVHFSSRPFFTASSMISDHGSMKYFPVDVAADNRIPADAAQIQIIGFAGLTTIFPEKLQFLSSGPLEGSCSS
jgi:hypothetical protein